MAVTNVHDAQRSQIDREENYFHLKEMEIGFKGARPKNKFMLVFDIQGDRRYKSDVYERSGEIRWKNDIYLKPSTLAELTIEVVHGSDFHLKLTKDYATISLDFTKYDAISNQDLTVEEHPKIVAKLSFGDALPLSAVIRLLSSETSSALGSKVGLLDKIDRVLSFIDVVIQLGETAGQAAPFASAVFSSARMAFDRCQAINAAHQIAVDLMDDMVSLLPLPDMLRRKVQEPETKKSLMDFLELIKDTMDALNSYAAHSTSGFYMRNWFNSKQDTFVRLKQRLDSMKQNTDLFIGASTLLLASKVHDSTKEVQKSVVNIHDLQILDRLSPVREAYYNPDEGCLEGTRTKFLDGIITKVKSRSLSSRFYWVFGLAGSGKSTVSTSIAAKLDKEGLLGGCFFFKRDIPELRAPRRVLPTLSHSLSQVHEPYRKHILSVIEKDGDIAGKAPKLQLEALFGKDMQIDPPENPYVFVVDALDECGEAQDRSTIAYCLVQLTQDIPWLKVVLTSRPIYEVQQILQEEDGSYEHPVVISFDLNAADDVEEDISKYNEAWLKQLPELSKKWLEPDWLQILTERACGLFIWSSTVAKYVKDAFDCNRALEQVLDETKSPAQGPLATLDELYRFVLEQVRGDRLILKKALGILVCTTKHRPLTPQGLYDLIPTGSIDAGLTYTALKAVLKRLQSVLHKDTSAEGVVRVCHPSFLDFMSSRDRSGPFWTDPVELNVELYRRCMQIMDKGLQFNICKLESAYVLNTEVRDLHQKIIDNIPSSLRYCCIHWMDHLLEAKASIGLQDPSVETTVSRLLCDTKALFWLEVLSLTKEVRAGITTLSHCVKAYQPSSKIALASAELFKFTTAYYDVIYTSTPHLYVSALSWAPIESYIGRELASKFSNQPIVTSGRLRSWKPILWSASTSEVFIEVKCSPDASLVVSAMADLTSGAGLLLLWNAQTGELVGEPFAKTENVIYRRVEFSPDGKCIAASDSHGELSFWDVQTHKAYEKGLKRELSAITCFKYSPSGNEFVSSSVLSKSLSTWDLRSGELIVEFTQMDDIMTCLCYSPNGANIVSGSGNGLLHVWDARTGKIIGEPLTGHTGSVYNVAFSPDGRYIASASEDKNIRLWNANERQCLHAATCAATMRSLEFSPNGKYILTGSSEGSICLLEPMENGESSALVTHTLRGSFGLNLSTTYSSDGRYFVSAAEDGSIRLWDASAVLDIEETPNTKGGHSSDIESLDFSLDGTTILSGSKDGSLRFWNAETGEEVGEPILQDQVAATYSPDGNLLLSWGLDNTLYLWESQTRKVMKKLSTPDEETLEGAEFSSDGRYISAYSRSKVYVWDVRAGDLVANSAGAFEPESITSDQVSWSPDNKHILFSTDKEGIIYDVESNKPVLTIANGSELANYVYAPDGKDVIRILKSDITMYDAASGEPVDAPLTLDMKLIVTVGFSRDGKYLALASLDRKLWILELKSKMIVAGPILGHSELIRSLTYSPDGRFIGTGSTDDSIRIWDTEFLMRMRSRQQSTVVNILKDGTHQFESEKDCEPTNDLAGKTVARRILPAGVAEDGWYRNTEGGLLLWIPHEYRADAVDTSKICIPPAARRDLNYNFELLSRYEGASWANIYSED